MLVRLAYGSVWYGLGFSTIWLAAGAIAFWWLLANNQWGKADNFGLLVTGFFLICYIGLLPMWPVMIDDIKRRPPTKAATAFSLTATLLALGLAWILSEFTMTIGRLISEGVIGWLTIVVMLVLAGYLLMAPWFLLELDEPLVVYSYRLPTFQNVRIWHDVTIPEWRVKVYYVSIGAIGLLFLGKSGVGLVSIVMLLAPAIGFFCWRWWYNPMTVWEFKFRMSVLAFVMQLWIRYQRHQRYEASRKAQQQSEQENRGPFIEGTSRIVDEPPNGESKKA